MNLCEMICTEKIFEDLKNIDTRKQKIIERKYNELL